MMARRVNVHTHSGFRADEYPEWFEIGGVRREVVDIEDRWHDPSYEAFRVFADDGRTYILRNLTGEGYWDMIPVT